MSLLIFILVVLVLLALVLYAIRSIPLEAPVGAIIQVIAILIAALAIAQHAGIF